MVGVCGCAGVFVCVWVGRCGCVYVGVCVSVGVSVHVSEEAEVPSLLNGKLTFVSVHSDDATQELTATIYARDRRSFNNAWRNVLQRMVSQVEPTCVPASGRVCLRA